VQVINQDGWRHITETIIVTVGGIAIFKILEFNFVVSHSPLQADLASYALRAFTISLVGSIAGIIVTVVLFAGKAISILTVGYRGGHVLFSDSPHAQICQIVIDGPLRHDGFDQAHPSLKLWEPKYNGLQKPTAGSRSAQASHDIDIPLFAFSASQSFFAYASDKDPTLKPRQIIIPSMPIIGPNPERSLIPTVPTRQIPMVLLLAHRTVLN
jgi:hypothetical protein